MKTLVLNDEIKYRKVDRYTRNRINESLIERQRKILLVRDNTDKLKEVMTQAVGYILDPELRVLWDKYPRIFRSTDRVKVSAVKFGVFSEKSYTEDEEFEGWGRLNVPTTLELNGIQVPATKDNYWSSYDLTEEDIAKIPEKELNIIKDLLYNIITGEYQCQKAVYNPETKKRILYDGMTYQNLFNTDKELYEQAVVKNFSENYLTYIDDGKEDQKDMKKQRQQTKVANMDKNQAALDGLKSIIGL